MYIDKLEERICMSRVCFTRNWLPKNLKVKFLRNELNLAILTSENIN